MKTEIAPSEEVRCYAAMGFKVQAVVTAIALAAGLFILPGVFGVIAFLAVCAMGVEMGVKVARTNKAVLMLSRIESVGIEHDTIRRMTVDQFKQFEASGLAA